MKGGKLMKYLHNYVSEQIDESGFVSFSRFYPEQLEAYQIDAMSKAMVKSTSGMYLGFTMTGSKIAMELKKENRLKLILPIVRQVKLRSITKMMKKLAKKELPKRKKKNLVDGIDLVVDSIHMKTIKAKNGKLKIKIKNPKHEIKEVRIYLPAIESISIKNLVIQGEVTQLPERKKILCLGDSITQGLIAGGPSLNYVALLADYLQMDALNQGVGGYTFCKDSLNGLEKFDKPSVITVAYGTNDWASKPDIEVIKHDIIDYLHKLYELFPDVMIYVITPIWRADFEEPVPCQQPFSIMTQIIEEVIKKYKNMQIIDGDNLVDHDRNRYADAYLHPNAVGFAQMARKLEALIEKSIVIDSQ